MNLFFKKRDESKEELAIIEKIEKRIAGLIKEWNESYENEKFLFDPKFESFMQGLMRQIRHDFNPHFHIAEDEPKIGYATVIKQNKAYKKLWSDIINQNKKILKLAKKGNYQESLKLVLLQIDLFKKSVINLEKYEIKRWDEIQKNIHSYIHGKSVGELVLPKDQYYKRRVELLYRWNRVEMKSAGISEARHWLKISNYIKDNRCKITNKIILICKVMEKDIYNLLSSRNN